MRRKIIYIHSFLDTKVCSKKRQRETISMSVLYDGMYAYAHVHRMTGNIVQCRLSDNDRLNPFPTYSKSAADDFENVVTKT